MATIEQHTSAGHLTGHDTCRDSGTEECFTQSLTGKRNDRMLHICTCYALFLCLVVRFLKYTYI